MKTLCFLLMLYCLKCTASRNSAITCAVTNVSVIFTCKCIGHKDVDAVYWYSGSAAVPLTIVAKSCRVLSLERSPFVQSYINITCDVSDDIYTLNLTNKPPRDSVSCTCLDPFPQEPATIQLTMCPEAVSTTTPSGNSVDVVRDVGESSLWYIGLIIGGCAAVVFGIGICWICKRNREKCKRSTGKYKIAEKKNSSVLECSYPMLNKNDGQESFSQDGSNNYNDISQVPHINIA